MSQRRKLPSSTWKSLFLGFQFFLLSISVHVVDSITHHYERCPSVGPMLSTSDENDHFESKKLSSDIIIDDTRDDGIVASDVSPRYLFHYLPQSLSNERRKRRNVPFTHAFCVLVSVSYYFQVIIASNYFPTGSAIPRRKISGSQVQNLVTSFFPIRHSFQFSSQQDPVYSDLAKK